LSVCGDDGAIRPGCYLGRVGNGAPGDVRLMLGTCIYVYGRRNLKLLTDLAGSWVFGTYILLMVMACGQSQNPVLRSGM